MSLFHLLWLIPALPLGGAVLVGLGRSKLPRGLVAWIAPGTVGLACMLAVFLAVGIWTGAGHHYEEAHGSPGFLELVRAGEHGVEQGLWTWIPGGENASGPRPLEIHLGLHWDGLTALMVLVVTFVGFWIHVYSIGYMSHDEGFNKFFCYLNLFVFFMLVLVLGSSLPALFIGWEGVGLCSYLLIGFWYQKKWPQDASVKAFVTNRVGDLGFVLAMLWAYATFGTLHIQTLLHEAGAAWHVGHGDGHGLHFGGGGVIAAGIALLLFLGATGKSAQIPLYVWLPDAMAGPTPVSALIHAATMVTAGVYMMCRMGWIFVAAPSAMAVVAGVGALTALFAATMGMAAFDIKKVLAYSTVSQLGYMVMAVGVGAFGAALFHLMTHAFFKALLFLGAGSVMHAMSDIGDIRKMGGLKDEMPHTFRTFVIASVAIAGIFPLAGFWSKDEILWLTFGQGAFPPWYGYLLWGVGALTALLTAFYMFRLVSLTFLGEKRWPEEVHPHESPKVMTIPLWVLAVGSVLAGFVGLPATWFPNLLEKGLHGSIPPPDHPHLSPLLELGLMAFSLVLAVVGIYWGLNWYAKHAGEPARRAAARLGGLYRTVANRWFVDEIYWGWILYPYRRACHWLRDFDAWVVDGIVNGTAVGYKGWCLASHWVDVIVVDGAVKLTGWTSKGFGWSARRLQTGFVANYLFLVVCGVFLLGAVYLFVVVL